MNAETTKFGGNITHVKLNYACLSARFVTEQKKCLPGVVSFENMRFLVNFVDLDTIRRRFGLCNALLVQRNPIVGV